jgi:hypothetical protein
MLICQLHWDQLKANRVVDDARMLAIVVVAAFDRKRIQMVAGRGDHDHAAADESGYQRWQAIILALWLMANGTLGRVPSTVG